MIRDIIPNVADVPASRAKSRSSCCRALFIESDLKPLPKETMFVVETSNIMVLAAARKALLYLEAAALRRNLQMCQCGGAQKAISTHQALIQDQWTLCQVSRH